jgi:hypothetical protein
VSSLSKALLAVGALASLAVVPGAFARSTDLFGPDLRVAGQSATNGVTFTLVLSPSYNTAKPGVTVTMTTCGQGPKIRLLRRLGGLGQGQSLQARPGRIVWNVASVPARPAKAKLRLRLASPQGRSSLCVHTSMYDRYTKSTIDLTNRVPL